MSSPPQAPPQYSPDGRYYWDGVRWVPVQQPFGAAGPPPRGGFPVWGWFAIGCGVLLVLGIAGTIALGVFGIAALSRIQCPPTDFPVPPSSTRTSYNVHVGAAESICDVSWKSNTEPPDVAALYQQDLNSGDWHVTSNDPSTGIIFFERVSDPGVHGQIELVTQGMQTEVQLHMTSDHGSFAR